MRFRLGLTGSIGMGKSTTASMFADEGCRVWDADAAVHRLYAKGGAAVTVLSDTFPDAIVEGAVSREVLKAHIQSDRTLLKTLETIVHPLVAEDRAHFIQSHSKAIGVFDIPLLFETGADAEMDATACVTVSREIQKERVLARGTMSEDDLNTILARQMPNDEKCARADFVIVTETLEGARSQVKHIVSEINTRLEHA